MILQLGIAVGLLAALLPGPSSAADPSTRRASVAHDGSQANELSEHPNISGNGEVVAFRSIATNLVPGDTNGRGDVFVRDLAGGTTERVSVHTDGTQDDGGAAGPALSHTGRVVAFSSFGTTLVDGDTNGDGDVFVHDRQTGTTERVSVRSDGGQATGGNSFSPTISGDGRLVAFASSATNLVDGDTNATSDIFVRDRANGTTTRISLTPDGSEASGFKYRPEISRNSRFVVFVSSDGDLVPGDTNGVDDVFIHDRRTGTTELVSRASGGGFPDGDSDGPGVSDDGRFVAFQSEATNLVPGGSNAERDIFVRDRMTGTTHWVSVSPDGDQGNGRSEFPSISADGRYVVFASRASNLVAGDTNGFEDVFVWDLQTGETVRVSVGSQGDGDSQTGRFGSPPVIAGRLPLVAFESEATNFVPGDTNGAQDVFVREFLDDRGYLVMDELGGVFAFGEAPFLGSVPALRDAGVAVGQAEVVDLAVTPSGNGYYVLDEVGGIFAFGDAPFHGSLPGLRAAGVPIGAARAIDIAVTPTGDGYLVLDEAGGIFAFGDAGFFGSLPGLREAGVPIGPSRGVDLAVTPTGEGYLLLDDAGGIFTFGDAGFFGSVPGLRAAGVPIGDAAAIRLEGTPTGDGYLVLDEAGGIFAFGDAGFFGSLPGLREAGVPIGPSRGVDLAVTPTGEGYLLLDDAGGIFTFGDAGFFGSVPGLRDADVPVGPGDSIRVSIVSTLVGG